MTPDTAPAQLPIELLTFDGYLDHAGVSRRTLLRWLGDDELPGAVKDTDGRWMIPADAVRTPRPVADIVQMTPDMTRDTAPVIPRSLDDLPSFLTPEQASVLLSSPEVPVPASTIRRDREGIFGTVKVGRKKVVPLATIKKIRGVQAVAA